MLDWRMNQPVLPFAQTETPTLLDAVADFKAVYMAARNYSPRTREEYVSDLDDLAILFCCASDVENSVSK